MSEQTWPIDMDWPTFMRPYRIGVPLLDGVAQRSAIISKLLPVEEGVQLEGGIRLCRAAYNREDERAETLEKERGPCFVLTLNGIVIGGVDRYALWIEPPFRKRDLGVELYVAMFIALGPERWVHNIYTKRGMPQTYTAAGFESRRRAYLALVDRGYIRSAVGVPKDVFEAHKATRGGSE